MTSPASRRWSEGARLRLVPAVIRQYSNVRPRPTSSRRSRSTSSFFVWPGAHPSNTASIEATTRSEASRSSASSAFRLSRTQPLQRKIGVDDLAIAESVLQQLCGVPRQEGRLDADLADRLSQSLDMLDGLLDCAEAVACGRLDDAGPKLAELLLVFFERVSDIGRVVGAALLIDQDRQIAADPEGIHVIEEEEAIAAKQILHIVLGGRQEDVDALVFEQGVESRRVEGRVLCLIMSSFVHVVSPATGGHFKLTLR